MSKSEKMIRNLRNRKIRILGYFIATICFAIAFAYCFHIQKKALTVCTPDDIKTVIAAIHMPSEFAELLSSIFIMCNVRADLTLFTFLFACIFGVMLGFLIIEITGNSKDMLIVRMWDEIQELKTQINDLQREKDK